MKLIGLSATTVMFGERIVGKITSEKEERVTIDYFDPQLNRNRSFPFPKKEVNVLVPIEEVENSSGKELKCKYCGSNKLKIIAYSGSSVGTGYIKCTECGNTLIDFSEDLFDTFDEHVFMFNEMVKKYGAMKVPTIGAKYKYAETSFEVVVLEIKNDKVRFYFDENMVWMELDMFCKKVGLPTKMDIVS